MDVLVLLLTGFVVGAMNAIAGGGMLLGFPVLIAMGIPPIIANATASIITAPGQITSAIGYRKFLRKVPKRYALLLIPLIIGALVGALLLRYTPHDNFEKMIPLLVLFGVLLFALQPYLHFHLHRHVTRRSTRYLPIILIGLALIPLSIYGSYFGAGYGLLLLAFLGFTNLHDTHMMNAMKNVAAVFVSVTGVIVLFGAGLIDWRLGGIMAIGAMVGGYSGAVSAQRVSSHSLRIVVIILGLCAVAYLALREY